MNNKDAVENLAKALGLTLQGDGATDVRVYDDSVYKFFLSRNSLAIGESYMDKKWDCDDLAGMLTKVFDGEVQIKKNLLSDPQLFLRTFLLNLQSGKRAFEVGEQHYDLGNDLYEATLGKTMVYTSAIYEGVTELDEAQEQKLERICRKLNLKPGQCILDIGCGWGSFMKYAAEKYDVSCVGLSVSKKQTEYGRELCAGLPIEFIVKDYRDYVPEGQFDHIVSIEMIEAVGQKNMQQYFNIVHALLKPGGCFMLQAIISDKHNPLADPWIDRYIFPNGVLVSSRQIEKHTHGLFMYEDLKNIGLDYDKTLMDWWANFDREYPRLKLNNPKYDERFYRMWKYYLHSCAAVFRAREAYDWQLLLRKI